MSDIARTIQLPEQPDQAPRQISRLAVTEAVFGVLLAALAVQLMLDGLSGLGIISMLGGH